MASSVDGLVSGLSTSDLINQLMQAESLPKQKLQQKLVVHQSTQSALQQVNTKLKSLFTGAEALTKPDAYAVTKAVSSSDAVVASATTGAATGQLTFSVESLAKAHVVTAQYADATGPVVDTVTGLSISIGGVSTPITVAADKNTPQGVAEAINAANLSVKAAAVDVGGGKFVLQLTATKTGTANAMTVSGLTSPANDATTAVDAAIKVGTGVGAYTVKSSTNTFAGLISGVTLTATKVASDVTVGVTRDVDGIANKIKTMVDAANLSLADISLKAATDSKTSPLKGNAMIRQISSKILSAVAGGQQVDVGGVPTYSSFKTVGVELDKAGRLTFDKAVFTAAYEKDPVGTQKIVQVGLAAALKGVADGASNATNGTITQTLTSGDSYEKRLTTDVSNWDNRLDTRKKALQRQFTGLEVALGKMKNQASWLSGQLASLG